MFVLALVACSLGPVNEKNFVERYVDATCSFDEYCNRTAFIEVYGDVDECIEESLDAIDDAEIDFDDCDFDKDKAKDCLKIIKDATEDCDVEDVVEADECAEAFDCGDDGGGLGGIGPGGVTEDNFGDKYFEAYCAAPCSGDVSLVCDTVWDTTTTDEPTSTCDFDAAAAAECVNVSNWTCEPLIDGSDDTYPTAPSVCSRVCG